MRAGLPWWGALARLITLVAAVSACQVDPELQPDALLRSELGLTDRDRVHRVRITGGAAEVAVPAATTILTGAYVEFVAGDWLVHEIVFEVDSLAPDARAFLESTDQVASPPLLRLDSRYVVHFEDSPPGRYPFVMAGSTAPGRGVVIVEMRP
ncbi:MAG: hypothetical protein VX815_09100 [Gemmatimonadota bacterium]|nr:hypothetical protein [Gemmatimonadota bacterium]